MEKKSWKSEVLQNGVQFGHRFARTCSSPELMNARVTKDRGRKQDNRVSESDYSKVTESCIIKVNSVDSSTRENSPSESYDGDVETASTSSRYAGEYLMGEDISSGVKPIQKSANVTHSPWIQTFGRQFVRFPLPEAGWNLNNLYYPHGLLPPSTPIIGRLNDGLQPESSEKQVVDHGFWENDVRSSVERNNDNGFLESEYMERKQNTENGVPLSDAETKILNSGALQYPISNMNYPTPNWVLHMSHNPSRPTPANNYPPFPVTFLPAGFADPYASILPYSTYTCQFNGKGDDISVGHSGPILDTANNSKMVNGIGSAEHSEEPTSSDILSGDISSHVSNMLYGRSCQSVQFNGLLFYCPSIVSPQYLQGQFQTANESVLPETPLMPVSHHLPNQRVLKNGYQYYPKGVTGYGMGTGTYFPNPKSSRDFQTPNSRYHRGNYRNNRKEQYREREVNSNFNSRPRFGGRSRKWEKPNPSFDRSSGRNYRDHSQWEAHGNYSQPTTHYLMVYDPNSGYGSLEHPPEYANSSPDQPSSPRLKGSLIAQ